METIEEYGVEVFADKEKFTRWFSTYNEYLGHFPNKLSAEEVMHELDRINYGNFA